MWTEFKRISSLLLSLTAVFGLGLATVSCQPEGLVDESECMLYYPDITDIGPSTNMKISPNWHGAKPADFKLYRILHETEQITSECFTVDPENGDFSISNTDELPVGKYFFSISCVSKGKTYQFENIITVNMMKPIPDGIHVEPALIEVSRADVLSTESTLPTAQIVTEGESISITKYIISGVTKDGQLFSDWQDLFSVNSSGVFKIANGYSAVQPGKYVIDFRLTTLIVDAESEDGLFQNALTVDITSAPLSLDYLPAESKVEKGYAKSSAAPQLVGSLDDVHYEIVGIAPEDPGCITIDEKTGVLSVAEGNTLEIGSSYSIEVKVTNKYSGESDNVTTSYTFNVVAYIAPITKLSYNNIDVIEEVVLNAAVADVDGDDLVYSFVEKPDALKEMTIDAATGTISLPKGHKVALGEYDVKVKAENVKSDATTDIHITVSPNENKFSEVRWGNNLDLPATEADQFRVKKFPFTAEVLSSDIKEGRVVKYRKAGGHNNSNITVDEVTGAITIEKDTDANDKHLPMSCVFVEVTVGEGDASIVRKFPVFFQSLKAVKNVTVEYTPFVFKCNPKTGGVSAAPVISGTGYDPNAFVMDYRRTFNYYNLNGPASHINGQPSAAGSFMRQIWDIYWAGVKKNPNYGSKDPLSALSASTDANLRLGYVMQDGSSKFAFSVAPEKWKDADGNYANGVFIGQMTFAADAATVNNGSQVFPLFTWFDINF